MGKGHVDRRAVKKRHLDLKEGDVGWESENRFGKGKEKI